MYLHACTWCDCEEINESSFESMRATSGRSATRSVRPEGVQGVVLAYFHTKSPEQLFSNDPFTLIEKTVTYN